MHQTDAPLQLSEPDPLLAPGTPYQQRLTTSAWAWLIALVAWSLLAAFFDLDGGARFEPTDCWVAQTAREMREDGTLYGYLIPVFSGETRMQKSPGPYWAVILTSWLRGTPVDEVAARIPNGFAAVLIVLCVFWLTLRIAGERAAVFAGFATASSVLTLYWSHRGASDLGLAALMTLSLTALWVASELEPPGRRRHWLWMLGYFSAGLAMLYKMPMPLVCVGLPAFLYLLLRNRWRVLASPWHLLGLVAFCLPWLPWALAVLVNEPTAWDKWRVEYFDRFTGDLPNVEFQRQWTFYFLYLIPPVIFCLPYSLSLPMAFWRGVRRQAGVLREGQIFLLIWFFSLLAFFTASTGKELRYFLPALPPLFVLLGIELSAFFNPARKASPRRDRIAAALVWIGLPAFFAAGAVGLRSWYDKRGVLEGFAWPEVWIPYAVTAAIFVIGGSLCAWLYIRRKENVSFAALVVTMWATWSCAWPNLMPILVSQRPMLDFVAQVKASYTPEQIRSFKQVGTQDSRITWYGDLRFPRVIDQLDLLKMQGGQRSLARELHIIGEEMIRQLESTQPVLFVATRADFVLFQMEANRELAARGRAMPPVHLWTQTRIGAKNSHFVVFGNRPPPWPEPALAPPSEELARALREIAGRPTTSPASQPTPGS